MTFDQGVLRRRFKKYIILAASGFLLFLAHYVLYMPEDVSKFAQYSVYDSLTPLVTQILFVRNKSINISNTSVFRFHQLYSIKDPIDQY